MSCPKPPSHSTVSDTMITKIQLLKGIVSLVLGISLLLPPISQGQGQVNAVSATQIDANNLNPNYRLNSRDRIAITVFDEPDLSLQQGIDARGEIKVPMIGVFRVEGMTIREVEKMLEREYVDQKILRVPIVTLDVLAYAPKEVSVLGAVARPGLVVFPPEVEKMDIVEVISMVGDFTPLAKSKDVKVTRTLADGTTTTLRVNVEEMIEGKKGRVVARVYIYPGDQIFVEEHFL